jgi:hypothetical protein
MINKALYRQLTIEQDEPTSNLGMHLGDPKEVSYSTFCNFVTRGSKPVVFSYPITCLCEWFSCFIYVMYVYRCPTLFPYHMSSTGQVSLVEQELLPLSDHLGASPGLKWVRPAQSLVVCIVLC